MVRLSERPAATLSLDLDDLWAYLRTRGDSGWQEYPSYLDRAVPRMLDLFHALKLKITVFVVGADVENPRNREFFQAILGAGHELANHSYHHAVDFHNAKASTVDDELERTENAIQAVGGMCPVGFRGPSFRLSKTILKALVKRDYLYDASTFPTFAGPLARAYYQATSSLNADDNQRTNDLFGSFGDGRQPLTPYRWGVDNKVIFELPVTTFPFIRMPIHMTYINFLAEYSSLVSRIYLGSALGCCRMSKLAPSLLLHAADFIGSNDPDCPRFLPGMRRTSEEKISSLHAILDRYKSCFNVLTLRSYAEDRLSDRALVSRSASDLN
jgi:peptidoglycan-N-acetylglucosamine deacetylase